MTTRAETDDAAHWRAELLAALLRWVLIIGAVVAVPSAVLAARVGEPAVVVLDVVVLAVMAVLAFASSIPYAIRAWSFIAFVFVFGVGLLATVGMVAQVYLLAVPILAVVLLGTRPALVALAANAVTLVLAGVFFDLELVSTFPGVDAADGGGAGWAESFVVALNFLLVDTVLTLSAGHLIGRLVQSLDHQRGIAASLAAEQASLRQANAELVVEVAERQRAEAEVHRLAMAIEQSSEVVLIAGLDGRVAYANRAHRELVDRVGVGAAVERLDDLGVPSGGSGTVVIADSQGVEHQFAARVSPLHSPEGATTHHVAVLRDVTDELRLRERVRRSERLEALASLTSGTAHDFNNVTAAIRMVAEVTRNATDDPEIVRHMDVIVEACNRARDVVRRMKAFGSPAELERENVALRDAIEEAVSELRTMSPPAVEVHTVLVDDGEVLVNTAEVREIVGVLIDNAVEAMATEHGEARGTITVSVVAGRLDDSEVVLEVADSGRGIAPEVIERIFDPFFTTKEPGRGSGLGLAGLHGLVSSLGGSVAVDSEVDIGTTVRVAFPRVGARSAAVGRAAAARAVAVPGRILFVDDEEAIRTMAERFLAEQGHMVTAAFDGLDAIEQVEAAPHLVDLVITDWSMPRLDGRALIARLRSIRPDVKVVVSSGFGELDEAELTALRVDGVLSKPYELAHLAETVRAALAD